MTTELSEVVLSAARATFGTQKSAALLLGKDEGNFTRDTKADRMTTGHMKALGPQFLAKLGEELVRTYGAAAVDPRDQALDLIPQMVEQFVRAVRG